MPQHIQVSVIFPIYRTQLSPMEEWAVRNNLDTLRRDRDIVVVCPEDLDLSPIDGLLGLSAGRCRVERFEACYFAGRQGYNTLMLSLDFYQRFHLSDFVLICQTDVLLLSDQLDYWCQQPYDYVGAPWLPARADVEGWRLLRRTSYQIRRLTAHLKRGFSPMQLKWKVGNGGLSLRRVEAMLRVLETHAEMLKVIAVKTDSVENFEDVVWGVRVNKLWPGSLSVPEARLAAHFAFEGHPDMGLQLTDGMMPMGAHAFFRHRNRGFWQAHVPSMPRQTSLWKRMCSLLPHIHG